MYAVRAWGSHALLESSPDVPTLHGTYATRAEAMRDADLIALPIVDTVDIGEVGRCPRAPGGLNLGHRFTGHPDGGYRVGNVSRCTDCGAYADELYIPGTYLPRDPEAIFSVRCNLCGSADHSAGAAWGRKVGWHDFVPRTLDDVLNPRQPATVHVHNDAEDDPARGCCM